MLFVSGVNVITGEMPCRCEAATKMVMGELVVTDSYVPTATASDSGENRQQWAVGNMCEADLTTR